MVDDDAELAKPLTAGERKLIEHELAAVEPMVLDRPHALSVLCEHSDDNVLRWYDAAALGRKIADLPALSGPLRERLLLTLG